MYACCTCYGKGYVEHDSPTAHAAETFECAECDAPRPITQDA